MRWTSSEAWAKAETRRGEEETRVSLNSTVDRQDRRWRAALEWAGTKPSEALASRAKVGNVQAQRVRCTTEGPRSGP